VFTEKGVVDLANQAKEKASKPPGPRLPKGRHRPPVEEKVQEILKQQRRRRQARGADSSYRQGSRHHDHRAGLGALGELTEGPPGETGKGASTEKDRASTPGWLGDTPSEEGPPRPVHLHDHAGQIIFAILPFWALSTVFFLTGPSAAGYRGKKQRPAPLVQGDPRG